VAYSHNGGRFMLSKPIDGKPARLVAERRYHWHSNKDAAQAEAWHKAGVANVAPRSRPARSSPHRRLSDIFFAIPTS